MLHLGHKLRYLGAGRLGTHDVHVLSAAKGKEGHDEYIRRNALQFAFMERHEKIADGVFRVTYSNGAKMYVNYNDSPTVMDGVSIPAMDYVVSAGK